MPLQFLEIFLKKYAYLHGRHATSWEAGGAAAPPDFGRSEGAAGQRRRAALLPALPDF